MSNWITRYIAESGIWDKASISPPSVFNYFSPLYKIPGTSLFGPEYQIHTLSSAIARANFVDRVVDNNLGGGVSIDLAPFVAVAGDDGQLISEVERTLLHDNLSAAERSRIIAALSNARGQSDHASAVGPVFGGHISQISGSTLMQTTMKIK